MMTSVHALRETHPDVPLVERLLAAGLISEHQLQHVLREKDRCDRPIGEILLDLGMISQKDLIEVAGRTLGDEKIDLQLLVPDPRAIEMLSREIAERYCVLPVEYDPNAKRITLAVSASIDPGSIDDLSRSLHPDIEIATVLAAGTAIKSAIDNIFDVPLTIPEILREIDRSASDLTLEAADPAAYGHPRNRLIDAIVFEAARRDATVIHFEPEVGFVRVRLRIDGVLKQMMALHNDYWPVVAARLTAMSHAQPEEGRDSDQGRLPIFLGARRSTLHVSRHATIRGEAFVVSVSGVDGRVMRLEELGLDKDDLTKICMMMAQPEGLIVVAGPARSGKTTTLHSLLDYRSDESVAIVSLERRPTRQVPLTRQISNMDEDETARAAWFDEFANQDADVLMIGELRDRPTTAFALRAASSGHQVLTTVTASSTSAALYRLRELGLDAECIAANTVGVVAQRLIRMLCVHCRQVYSPSRLERQLLRIEHPGAQQLFREGACERCNHTGYRGRSAITDILLVEPEIAGLLSAGAPVQELKRAVSASGSVGFADKAVRQVLAGVTSISEASRVVDLSAPLMWATNSGVDR